MTYHDLHYMLGITGTSNLSVSEAQQRLQRWQGQRCRPAFTVSVISFIVFIVSMVMILTLIPPPRPLIAALPVLLFAACHVYGIVQNHRNKVIKATAALTRLTERHPSPPSDEQFSSYLEQLVETEQQTTTTSP